ncbi:hypothetical protein V466_25070 [Pseudomonas mandelii PD30]|uniref:Uncharacterized protein n=1 Tax=Pseudomonas mandelii PD30 TaxID=1419583 RepID=A0A059KWW2_9PSED|nr:hypothetical protein V466_25070 [Pseudomonas mandelii PD30]
MLKYAVTQRMAIPVIELLEMIDIQHDQCHPMRSVDQRMLQ